MRADRERFVWMQAHTPALAVKLGAAMRTVYGAALADYDEHIKPVLDAAAEPAEKSA